MLAISQKLLSAAATLNTAVATPTAFEHAACEATVHHVKWGTGVTSGAVTVEAADEPDYTGTWTILATVTFAGTAPNQNTVETPGNYRAMRHRVSTVVANGTVTTLIHGQTAS